VHSATTILCDFDGTVTVDDLTDAVLSKLADPSWLEVEAEWKAGRIDSATCMARQVRLLRGGWEDIAAIADEATVTPGFQRFAAWCAARGINLVIASDGLDFCIARVLARLGLRGLPVRANRLVRDASGRWDLETPHAKAGCGAGHCKCSGFPQGRPVFVIGDGRSDMCAAEAAGFVFAKGALLRHCLERGIPHQPFLSFEDVIRGLERFEARGPAGRELTREIA
jgi:2-hydroxy-3-keto-5-methylthiopentenyl-1-phosphate phosphatase